MKKKVKKKNLPFPSFHFFAPPPLFFWEGRFGKIRYLGKVMICVQNNTTHKKVFCIRVSNSALH